MLKFKKNRVELLKALRDLITKSMDSASINPNFEEDVAEFFTEITDKRRCRRLRSMRKEVDKWIEELIASQKTLKESYGPRNLRD